MVVDRFYDMSQGQRDALMVRLRAKGWSLRRIAKYMGISPNGVVTALARVEDGRPGRDTRYR